MPMVDVRRPLLLAGLALMLLLTPAAVRAAGAPDAKDKESPAEKIKKQLNENITLEIAEQPLSLALNQIREHTKINFVVDKMSIQQLGMDPDQMPVNAKLKDVKVRTALRSILSPYNLGYAIIGDTVLISTDDMAMFRQMRQRVSIDLEKVDLAAALKQLSKETATNVMLDTRAAKEGKTPVSLQMEDVPLETSVRLLAEMAGLKPVKVGNVLFVTTKAYATEMRSDPDLNQQNGGFPPPQPGMMPGMPGGPGFPVPPGGGIVPLGPGAAPAGTSSTIEVPAAEKPVDPDKVPAEPGDKKPAADPLKPDKSDPKPPADKGEPQKEPATKPDVPKKDK